ncbi:hypothetical protein NC651_036997 [Populus alba x Populus x berolinensis]|nr:hypothetical protein NC651_036997 [Populus alba x Populus x berolinensis]
MDFYSSDTIGGFPGLLEKVELRASSGRFCQALTFHQFTWLITDASTLTVEIKRIQSCMREWGLCGAAKDDLPSIGKSSLATQLPPFLVSDLYDDNARLRILDTGGVNAWSFNGWILAFGSDKEC